MSPLQIFFVMLMAGLAAIGGGSGSLAVAQHAWVETGYLRPELYAWTMALGHVTPGPLSTAVVGMGYYLAGLPGAGAALVGISLPTWAAACLAARGMERFRSLLEPLMRPAPYVVAGLAAATAVSVALPLRLAVHEAAAVAAVTWLVGWRSVDPVWIVAGAVCVGAAQQLFS